MFKNTGVYFVNNDKKRHVRVSQPTWKYLKQLALDKELTIDGAINLLREHYEKTRS